MSTTTESRRITDEDVAMEWRRRAARPGLRRVMRASQPDALNDAVTEQTRRVVGEHLTTVAARLGRRPGTALEIGCGMGRLTPTIAEHADRVLALDMTGAMLDHATAACAHLPTVDFTMTRADRMAVPEQPYDAAVCVWVLMHILDEEQLLTTCRRIAASTRHLTLVEYERARIPVSRWSRLRPLEVYLDLLPGAEVIDERVLDYGGDSSFVALITFPEEPGR